MRALKTLGIVLLVVVAGLVVVGFLLPSEIHVDRSTVIDAPPCTVYTLVNGFTRFNDWSPWFEVAPAEYSYAGPWAGVGARMEWTSDSPEVGSGSQEIVASEPLTMVTTRLDFGQQGTATAVFRLEPVEGGTEVTWEFTTDVGSNIISRYFGLFFDSMVGADYENGLASLKELAEDLPAVDFCSADLEMVDLTPQPYAYLQAETAGLDAVGDLLARTFGQVTRFMARHRLQEAGAPVAVILSWEEDSFQFRAGMPVIAPDEDITASPEGVALGTLPGGAAVRIVHVGPYDRLPETWEKVDAYAEVSGLERRDHPWEQFVSDPGATPEDELITHIFVPVE